jgi:LuxR family maltose regulon positive regulatory protein
LEEFRKSIELGKLWSNWESLLPAYTGLARVLVARGDCDNAIAAIDELAELVLRFHASSIQPAIDACYADVHLRCRNAAAAARRGHGSRLREVDSIGYDREAEGILLARVLVGKGRAKDALELLEKLLTGARAGGRTQRVIEILAWQVLALHELAQDAQAGELLRKLLADAEPEGYVRTFVDCGREMQASLERINTSYARKLRTAFRRGTDLDVKRRASAPSLSPLGHPSSGAVLSDRERQVLQLIADGLSNQEIANKLVISIRTVKKHVENMYGKLEVKSRTQAIARAKELGLL